MRNDTLYNPKKPLEVEEVIGFLKKKWGVSYEMRIVIRGRNIFLHIMWRYQEQKSFPDDEEAFRSKTSKVVEVLNRLDQSMLVRNWLLTVKGKPKLGKALSLRLKTDYRFSEFLI